MNDKDKIYLGALLHDIGKFIERAKVDLWKNIAYQYIRNGDASQNYAHRRFSAGFINEYKNKKDFLSDAVEALALYHHKGNERDKSDFEPIENKGELQKIIRIADDLASSERAEDET